MASKKRIEGATSAQVASVYGLGNVTPTYSQFVQLWLNIDSVLNRNGFYSAVSATVGNGESLPDQWIEAAIPNPVEASQWKRFDLKRSMHK